MTIGDSVIYVDSGGTLHSATILAVRDIGVLDLEVNPVNEPASHVRPQVPRAIDDIASPHTWYPT